MSLPNAATSNVAPPNRERKTFYLAGLPAMIDAAKHRFLAAGLDRVRLYYDSFEFGVDVPVRVPAGRTAARCIVRPAGKGVS